MEKQLERELKFGVEREFELPPLDGDELEPRVFESTYYDTDGFALLRVGITLRRRTENGVSLWQLKLPREEGRLELEAPGGPGGPPGEIGALLVGVVRSRELQPVARLRTRRTGVHVPGADVVLDTVDVLDGQRIVDAFAEVEIEQTNGGPSPRKIAKALQRRGAQAPDPTPKLARALGLDLARARPSKKASTSERLVWMLGAQVDAIARHEPGVRLGEDPEDLHQFRVAVRRLRAVLRAAGPVLDPEWVEPLRAELAWLAGALGELRDLHVLIASLEEQAAALEENERNAFVRALDTLREQAEATHDVLVETISSDRYFALLDRLEESARAPHVADHETPLAALAANEFAKLRKAVRKLPPEPDDDALHAIRIKGKRARYSAEMVGQDRVVDRAKALQDVIGGHQDAVVAEVRLRELAMRGGKLAAVAAGRLIERQRARRVAARTAFPDAWKRLERTGKRAYK